MTEANSLLQARFNRTKGKEKSLKQIEQDIKTNRPFAYLDRDIQRQIIKSNQHPEELSFLNHVEGLIQMAGHRCGDSQLRGLLEHISHITKDIHFHNWAKVRKWSNKVVVNTATGEWAWDQNDMFMQERNSQYVIQNDEIDTELIATCSLYNKGFCRHNAKHYEPDVTFVHACAFCFGIDGSREPHQSRVCGKRRSSANYFRLKEEAKDSQYDKKGKNKKPFQRNSEESKN